MWNVNLSFSPFLYVPWSNCMNKNSFLWLRWNKTVCRRRLLYTRRCIVCVCVCRILIFFSGGMSKCAFRDFLNFEHFSFRKYYKNWCLLLLLLPIPITCMHSHKISLFVSLSGARVRVCVCVCARSFLLQRSIPSLLYSTSKSCCFYFYVVDVVCTRTEHAFICSLYFIKNIWSRSTICVMLWKYSIS